MTRSACSRLTNRTPAAARKLLFRLAGICLLLIIPARLIAQVCSPEVGYNIDLAVRPGAIFEEENCSQYSIYSHCYEGEFSALRYEVIPSECNPEDETCSVRAVQSIDLPGLSQNDFEPCCTPALIFWESSAGATVARCGFQYAQIRDDLVDARITGGGFSCSEPDELVTADTYTITAITCPEDAFGCDKTVETSLPFTGAAVAAALCPPPPPKDECSDCETCPAGDSGTSVAGGGPSLTPDQSGPGATLRYRAGGVGHQGYPGSTEWTSALGRYWSHDYAERIVPDPQTGDETHVWLITKHGSFREFQDLGVGNTYDTNSPSDEYRTLEWLGAGLGWELHDLDGTVQSFDSSGHWTQTVDRNGNATEAHYDAFDRLEWVGFPDERREDFTYHTSGKLESITEVGVDGTTMRTWLYTWVSDDLTRIERPDGTALELFYEDPSFPSYLTRMELVGTSGGRRIERAWSYDGEGNVEKTWRGALNFTDEDAVDQWSLAFDNPQFPTVTELTDPLGGTATYTLERDTASLKAKVMTISGDCPSCSLGPNSQLFYEDPDHPLLVTRKIDGKGNETHFTYTTEGQVESKTEAFGTALLRTTDWQYDSNFPALVTLIRVPSTSGSSYRETAMSYDPVTGDMDWMEVRGFEELDGQPPLDFFANRTLYDYNDAGRSLTIDPPGFDPAPPGFDTDEVVFTYDSDRGDLIPETRADPEVGITSFGYDPFNRRTEVTDPNGVTTKTTYDDLNRVTSVIQGFGSGDELVTSHTYTQFGDLFRTTLPRGNLIEYGYDATGRLESIERKPDATTPGERTFWIVDNAGNRTTEKLQSWSGTWQTQSETDYQYTSRCQLDKVIRAPGTAEESVTEYAYDCNGNLEQVWDANHPSAGQSAPATQTYSYDELNRLKSVTQPWEGGGDATTTYGYDVQDHLTSATDAEGNLTTYTYSDRDLLTKEISPASGTTTYTYNEHGELLTETDPRGITITRTVDALDRLMTVTYPTDTDLDTTFTYDENLGDVSNIAIGRLVKIERGSQPPVVYHWDQFGRRTRDGELGYGYDDNGNRTSIAYPGSSVVTYTHDFADRPRSLEVQIGESTSQTLVSDASYGPSGPLTGLTFGNGLSETRTFDGRYYPDAVQVSDPSTLLSWDYTVDKVGNVTSIADGLNSSNDRSFGYAPVHYFLECAAGPWSPLGSSCDPVTESPRLWEYDRIGNRTRAENLPTMGPDETYLYEPSSGSGNSPLLDAIDPDPVDGTRYYYTFDASGNLTQVDRSGNVIDFTWDEAGRLQRAERTAADEAVTFTYDGRSFLSLAAEDADPPPPESLPFSDGFESGDLSAWSSCVGGPGCGTTVRSVVPTYSSEGLLYALGDESGYAEVFYFAGRPVAQVDTAGPDPEWTVLTTDHLGTPIFAADLDGIELWQGGFEPFGEDYADAQGMGIFLRLPGQWEDSVWQAAIDGAPLYYNVHRWYEYGTGRYTRVDPTGLLPDLDLLQYPATRQAPRSQFTWALENVVHPYGYARESPLVYLDVNGANPLKYLDPRCIFWGIVCIKSSTNCRERWECIFRENPEAAPTYFQEVGVSSFSGFYFEVCLNIPSCRKALRYCGKVPGLPKPTR